MTIRDLANGLVDQYKLIFSDIGDYAKKIFDHQKEALADGVGVAKEIYFLGALTSTIPLGLAEEVIGVREGSAIDNVGKAIATAIKLPYDVLDDLEYKLRY